MNKFRVIDLFSGCGGISVGCKMTELCDIVGAIDFNQSACNTYQYNFPNAKVICGDINNIVVDDTYFKDIDIIVGGPPCQGFSALNRHNKNLQDDPRNVLFLQFIRFVRELKPKAILIENVRQILTQKNGYAKNTIITLLDEIGYNVKYQVINASDYGVPQKRNRAVFVGIRKDIGEYDFSTLEKRKVINKTTVDQALEDLYLIEKTDSLENDHAIDNSVSNDYLKLMHDGSNIIHNHYMRYPNKKVQERISFVPEGGNWRNVPEELFPSHRNNRHSNYMKRINGKEQSITVDTGHDVYFHPRFNRNPTVRETARIQSFPDEFYFTGTKAEQLSQVGNAVPPLMAKAIVESIIETINSNQSEPFVIDLFSGAGGLSLGFEKAGFVPCLAIDFWKPAIDTYNYNRENKVGRVQDITQMDEKFFKELNIKNISGIIGGPPCQGFSMAGRRIIDDERNALYRDYFRILELIKPKFFLIENVVGLTTLNGGVIKNDIIKRANDLGYEIFFDILTASDYGVPQNRKRAFFIGIKSEIVTLKGKFSFPEKLDEKISCFDALSDLPNLDKGENNTEYRCAPQTRYQEIMRLNSTKVFNHQQSKHTQDTINAISYVPEGGGMKDIPIEIKNNRKYSSLLRRMDRKYPSQTIDTGHRTYFHYEENRVISVREAARLQSFPDDYVFCSTKQNQYKQVGNAVPPLLAYALANAIKDYLS